MAILIAPGAALGCDQAQLGNLRAALVAGRLIQAEHMLATMEPACREDVGYRAMAAQSALRAGRVEQARTLYAALAAEHPDNGDYASGAGRAALRLGRTDEALAFLTRAAALPGSDWRVWNALGIIHDRRREWSESAIAYARARQDAPGEAAIWANEGYSQLLQGRPAAALPLIAQALQIDPNNAAIRETRDLAAAMTGQYRETRQPGESDRDWARRLNNQGYAAWLAGDTATARRMLSNAIEVSDVYFERAAINLARVEGRQ